MHPVCLGGWERGGGREGKKGKRLVIYIKQNGNLIMHILHSWRYHKPKIIKLLATSTS